MTIDRRRRALALSLVSAGAAPACLRAAEAWPSRPIRIVVPLPAGGSPDILLRHLAEVFKRRLGQPVTVENRPGASGMIGLKQVIQSPADGYTLAYLNAGHVTIDVLTPGFDLLNEFTPLSTFSNTPYIFLVNAASPYQTLADVVAAARRHPGKLSYGSGGQGSLAHMCMAGLLAATGLKMLHVPYKGGVAALNGLAGGEVDFTVNVPGSVKSLVGGGRLRIVAAVTPRRIKGLPDVPTVQEAIQIPYTHESFGGLGVRKGTPPEIVAAWFKAITEAVKDPGCIEAMDVASVQPMVSASPEEFAALIRQQHAAEQALVRRLNIKLE